MTRSNITRIRHETRRRVVKVASVDALTPRMLRIGFTARDLHDFVSLSPDDHIKLFFSKRGTVQRRMSISTICVNYFSNFCQRPTLTRVAG